MLSKGLAALLFFLAISSFTFAQSPVVATSYNNVIEADQQSGSDACAKIATAIGQLPSTGGTVDAVSIQGSQTCAANPFASVTKPVRLLLGAVTITASACWSLPNNTLVSGSGKGITTLKLANSVNNCFLINNSNQSTTGNNHIVLENMTLDGNMVGQSPSGAQRTGCIYYQNVKCLWIQNNEIINCYHFAVEVLGQSQFGWIIGNRVDGTVGGSGILLGTTPLAVDGSGNPVAEAYDIHVIGNWIGNTEANCLFSTGSNTASSYGTARIEWLGNTMYNCGDVGIEVGDSTQDSTVVGNTYILPSLTITAISRSGNVVTATISPTVNTLQTGAPFSITGVSYGGATSFNGTSFSVSTVNNASNAITWAQTGENGTGSGGAVIRTGNAAYMARSSKNVSFSSNTCHGNQSGVSQDCFFIWGNSGDNGPKVQNITITGNALMQYGRYGIDLVSASAGQVDSIKIVGNQWLGGGTNDLFIGSNTSNVTLNDAGFITSGNAVVNQGLNAGKDITIQPDSSNVVHINRPIAATPGSASFSPDTGATVHIQNGGNANALTIEATQSNSNIGITVKNLVQSFSAAIRHDLGDIFAFRDITSSRDSFQLTPAGAGTFLSSVTATQLVSNVSTGTKPITVTSTTPVDNLTVNNHPTVFSLSGTQATGSHMSQGTLTLSGGSATATLSGSAAFTSSSSYGCSCTDQTSAAACKAVPASASSVTVAGTGTHVIFLQCFGN